MISDANHIIFVKRANGKITILIVYVDDIVVTGDDPYEVSSLKAHQTRELEIKELGLLHYLLGLKLPDQERHIYLPMKACS